VERYAMIEAMAKDYPVRELCAVLGVTRSGYYSWRNGQRVRASWPTNSWWKRAVGCIAKGKAARATRV
jgi:hypothetical protein